MNIHFANTHILINIISTSTFIIKFLQTKLVFSSFAPLLREVFNNFLEVQALMEPAILLYVVTVGRREPLAFAIYFMLLIQRVHHLSTLFNSFNYWHIWEELWAMQRAALARRPPPLPKASSSSSSPYSPSLFTLLTSPPHSPSLSSSSPYSPSLSTPISSPPYSPPMQTLTPPPPSPQSPQSSFPSTPLLP